MPLDNNPHFRVLKAQNSSNDVCGTGIFGDLSKTAKELATEIAVMGVILVGLYIARRFCKRRPHNQNSNTESNNVETNNEGSFGELVEIATSIRSGGKFTGALNTISKANGGLSVTNPRTLDIANSSQPDQDKPTNQIFVLTEAAKLAAEQTKPKIRVNVKKRDRVTAGEGPDQKIVSTHLELDMEGIDFATMGNIAHATGFSKSQEKEMSKQAF